MNIIDVIIIFLFVIGGIIGFKKGVITKLTSFFGLFLILILAFYLKNPLSVLMYENLPFFNFGGIIKGIGAINILIYELLAFIAILGVLFFVLKVLLLLTGLVEKILKMTIFLSIPSKILGIVVGALEAYVYIFIGLVILNLPMFNFDVLKDSKTADFIVNKTVILSPISSKLTDTYSKVYTIITNQKNKSNAEVNQDILIILLENEIVRAESVESLISANKLEVKDKAFLEDYKNIEDKSKEIIDKSKEIVDKYIKK